MDDAQPALTVGGSYASQFGDQRNQPHLLLRIGNNIAAIHEHPTGDKTRGAEAADFCLDPIDTISTPDWMPPLRSWFPLQAVHDRGLEIDWDANGGFHPTSAIDEQSIITMLFTVGVDRHTDNHGPTLLLVLHNDGLTFVQGRQRHRTEAGQWLIFDDTLPHEVREARTSTGFLCLSIPMRAWCRCEDQHNDEAPAPPSFWPNEYGRG